MQLIVSHSLFSVMLLPTVKLGSGWEGVLYLSHY